MKKLKLNLSNMKGTEILTREQLKNITGGDGAGIWCVTNADCYPKFYQCGVSPEIYQTGYGVCRFNKFPPTCAYGYVCIGEVGPISEK